MRLSNVDFCTIIIKHGKKTHAICEFGIFIFPTDEERRKKRVETTAR